MREDWLDILRRVKSGELSVEEASQHLEALETGEQLGSLPELSAAFPDETSGSVTQAGSVDLDMVSSPMTSTPEPDTVQQDLGWWRDAWLIPFWVGTGILVLGAILMGWAYSSQRLFWFYCSWLPLLIGIVALLLGWWSRQARWLHVRVQDAGGSRVSISMPLPLRFAGWALRVFGHFIPQLKDKDLSDMPVIFSTLAEAEGPLSVEVDDGGDRVRVYIL